MSPVTPLRRFTTPSMRPRLGQRSGARELLDAATVDPAELDSNLRDLARLNRLPGGADASIAAIERLAPGNGVLLRIVDVGTGVADIPRAALNHARRAGRRWEIVAVDSRSDVLAHAADRVRDAAHITLVQADARALPFRDAELDVAHSSLLIHHLDPDDAVAALREMARVARIGVVVNDVRRGIVAYALGAPVVLALSRSSMTRHDGLVSLRRAYTLRELDEMLDQAGLDVSWRSNRWMPRVVTAAVPRRSR